MEHLHIVLEILRLHKFCAKFSKCQFGMEEVESLGHVVLLDMGLWRILKRLHVW